MPVAPPARSVQVLVVDDSAVVREVVRSVLSRDPALVVTAAADPIIAMSKLRHMRPDVILLDLEMPRMNGLEFLRRIMAEEDPIPVVVCSSATGVGTEMAMRAVDEGAVEVIGKPAIGSGDFLRTEGERLIELIRAAARVRPRRRSPAPPPRKLLGPTVAMAPAGREPCVIAVGASLGGPEALRQILSELPPDLPPILIVQHMAVGFTAAFAARLNDCSRLSVGEATDGDRLRRGRVLVAPGQRHMRVCASPNGELFVSFDPARGEERHHPSVDVLFRSVARTAGPRSLGLLLTGMGRDGAEGLLELRKAGAHTIVQDEETSVVFGMPGAAVALGAAAEVLPLGLIAPAVAARGRSRSLSREEST